MNAKLKWIIMSFISISILLLLILKPFNTNKFEYLRGAVSESEYKEAVDYLRSSLNDEPTYNQFVTDYDGFKTISPGSVTLISEPETVTHSYEGGSVSSIALDDSVIYEVSVPDTGLYHLELDYLVAADVLTDFTIGVKVNGETQYLQSDSITVPIMWTYDQNETFFKDRFNNETVPRQEKLATWSRLQLYDTRHTTSVPLLFKLDGETVNTIEIYNKSRESLLVGDLRVLPETQLQSYEAYINKYADQKEVDKTIKINAIDYVSKNSSFVTMKNVQSPDVEPFDTSDKKMNVISGWERSGEEISYNVIVPETGLYEIAIHYRTSNVDFNVFRSLRINGEIPFEEVNAFELEATDDDWVATKFGGDKPYKFYLEAGKINTISLKADVSPLEDILDNLQLTINHINDFSLELKKIIGKEVDQGRTWQITKQLPHTKSNLDAYEEVLVYSLVELARYSENEEMSSLLSYLRNAILQLEKVSKNPDKLPLYTDELYSGSGSINQYLGDIINQLSKQDLELDLILLTNEEIDHLNSGFIVKSQHSINQFLDSFSSENYKAANDPEAVNIWVNRPLNVVDIMQKKIDSEFTPNTGIKVNLSVMPDVNKLVLANAAGKTPDVAIGTPSYVPFALSLRGALHDLSEFEDYWEYSSDKFVPGSLVPYVLGDGVYAVPETLTFNALIYRTDVFESLDLMVPDTWEDVIGILPQLQRYGMNFYFPTAGGGTTKWFYQTSPFIYQLGGGLYDKNGFNTIIDSKESVEGLKMLVDLYTTYSLPQQVPSFYTDFRYNKLPVGVIDFPTYVSLSAAAPELAGKWKIAPYPGIENDNGEIDRSYIGNGTNGIMFKDSDKKEEGWEFLKWWMSTKVQSDFAYTLQTTYGPSYLWMSGNKNAIAQLPIKHEDKEVILEQIEWLRDVPRTPGQYMLERGLSNIWNTAVYDGTPVRTAIDREIIIINREITKKMIEFGYKDDDGNVLKDYEIRDVDWIEEQMGRK